MNTRGQLSLFANDPMYEDPLKAQKLTWKQSIEVKDNKQIVDEAYSLLLTPSCYIYQKKSYPTIKEKKRELYKAKRNARILLKKLGLNVPPSFNKSAAYLERIEKLRQIGLKRKGTKKPESIILNAAESRSKYKVKQISTKKHLKRSALMTHHFNAIRRIEGTLDVPEEARKKFNFKDWYRGMKEVNLLDAKALKFCESFIMNGDHKLALKDAGYGVWDINPSKNLAMLHSPRIKQFFERINMMAATNLSLTLDWKLKKLMHVIELSAPDSARHHKEINATAAISAIAETNKMQGHYSADKLVTVNVNADLDVNKALEVQRQLLPSFEKDY